MKKLSMKGVSWDSFFLTFVRLVTTLTTMIQTKILSVGLGLFDYGSYSQAILVTGVMSSLIMFGLGDGLNYFYNRKIDEVSQGKMKTIGTIFAIEILLGLLGFLLVLTGQGALSKYFDNPNVSILLRILALKPLLDNILYLYQILFISIGEARVIAIRNLVISMAKVTLIGVSVVLFKSVMLVCAILIVLDAINIIIFHWLIEKHGVKFSFRQVDFRYVKEILTYSLPMGIFALTSTLLRDVDKLLIGKMASTEELAIYSNCSKILPFDILVASFATVLIPYIMKYVTAHDQHSTEMLFSNYLRVGYYSVWTFVSAVLVVSDQAITFFYSAEYLQGKTVFVLYLFDSMIHFASMHLILTASGRSKTIMLYSLISLLVNIILNIGFYKIFGLSGPAIATVLVTLIYTVMILRKTIKEVHIELASVIDVKELAVFIGILLINGFIWSNINSWMLRIKLDQYIAMIIVIGGYVCCVFWQIRKKLMITLRTINSLRSGT